MKLSDSYNVSELRPRATLLAVIFSFLFALLGMRLWYLQIWRGDEYRQFSDENRFKVKRLSAPRGKILDRQGRLLADNRPRFDVVFTRGFSSDLDEELKVLGEIFAWSDIEFEEVKRQLKKSAPYLAKRIARDVSWNELAQIESRNLELSGVDVEVIAVRDYLYGDAFFHSIGYTGEVNEMDLIRLRKKYPERNYRLGDQIGVIGTEARFESYLRGEDGQEFVVVDVKGRPVQKTGFNIFDQSSRLEAIAGKTLQLTLDLELQLEAVRAFEDKIGAAVAIEPETGEILAMVSRPGLNPNLFTREVSGKQLLEMRNRPDKPFLDRTIQEHYPPGSTLKLVMAAAALETDVIDPDTIIDCPGYYRLGRRVWHDHNRAGFGEINVHTAIKKSSNVFFFNVGMMLGLDNIQHWSKLFGLGRRTNLAHEAIAADRRSSRLRVFNSEQSGFIPDTEWIRKKGHTTVKAETINSAIGQGAFLVTVLQLSRMVSIFGNGGKVFQPQLLKHVYDPEGGLDESFTSVLENEIRLRPQTVNTVLSGMDAVVNESGGTARRARLKGYRAGGKTGTSQVINLGRMREQGLDDTKKFQDHALFVGLAPLDNPKIAVAVIVENGGSGGRTAAPIAGAMMQNYLNRTLPAGGEAVGKYE